MRKGLRRGLRTGLRQGLRRNFRNNLQRTMIRRFNAQRRLVALRGQRNLTFIKNGIFNALWTAIVVVCIKLAPLLLFGIKMLIHSFVPGLAGRGNAGGLFGMLSSDGFNDDSAFDLETSAAGNAMKFLTDDRFGDDQVVGDEDIFDDEDFAIDDVERDEFDLDEMDDLDDTEFGNDAVLETRTAY